MPEVRSQPLFDAEKVLRFEIPGKPISGNAKTRWVAIPVTKADGTTVHSPRAYSTREAREFSEKVKAIALRAAWAVQWKMPAYVQMDLWIYNAAQDRTNSAKVLEDSIQGVCYANDSRILDGRIVKLKDSGGSRIVVEIRAVNGEDYGYR